MFSIVHRKILTYLKTVEKIDSLCIDHRIKKRIKKTCLQLAFKSSPKDIRQPISIMGFPIYYLNFELLKFLFYEVFVEAEYLLEIDNPNPLILDCGSNIGMPVVF